MPAFTPKPPPHRDPPQNDEQTFAAFAWDASTQNAECPVPQPDMPLHVFRLEPATEASDPNWDNEPCHGVFVVRAYSPADARLVATDAESEALKGVVGISDEDDTTRTFSAFRNEKLYAVLEDFSFGTDGPRAVLSGTFSVPPKGP